MPVLVGFVPTPEGRAALRRAVLECHLRTTGLILVNAEHHSAPATTAESSAAEVRAVCAELGVSEPDLEIRRNRNAYEPADDVLSVAEEAEAELIVIGLRRRTAVGKLILGGSAQRILLDASCPVLAVKADIGSGWEAGPPGPALSTISADTAASKAGAPSAQASSAPAASAEPASAGAVQSASGREGE
jgi:nucleotide-binding universal stress UspA family protein